MGTTVDPGIVFDEIIAELLSVVWVVVVLKPKQVGKALLVIYDVGKSRDVSRGA